MNKWFLLSLLLILPASYGKEVSESLVVQELKWMSEKNMYRLSIHGRSGAYYASKEQLQCLRSSLSNKKSVKAVFDTRTLIIKSCSIN